MPELELLVLYTIPVSSFTAVTVADGTAAPEVSVTVPEMRLVVGSRFHKLPRMPRVGGTQAFHLAELAFEVGLVRPAGPQ